ncbi:hypothetical protein L202_02895 [Cryptococcus amylolentus CBS 6039]|uniref:Uncharacterized protein n=1 Tax=Cryptococcus amylolentus CBS 6039 TaxID=1295533 RepID=A0A1E3HX41_9TREE|nr:hypothetical protein L202_02895 [Cryptococcus amylolentus CBS 6039]ODN80735.1 hypothetical protein L202_02895 [Cryptococcus amylolentus CBS 6039]
MPSCRITNCTSHPLNISLKQVTALHFENGVQPGQTIKFKPGKVWFTVEAVLDDGTKKSRYSVLKSAATIAIISIAVGAVAATAGAALLPEVAALETVAAAGAVGSYIAKGVTATKTALVANSGTVSKISSSALPKAIDKLSGEVGGLTALQREVMSIVASPTLSSDVRHKSTALLRRLHKSYSDDRDKSAAGSSESGDPAKPSATLAPITDEEAKQLEKEVEEGKLDDKVENTPVRTGEVLRAHGIYMKERRHFEIRVAEQGKLSLYDVAEKKYIT